MKIFLDGKEKSYLEKFCAGLSEGDQNRFDLMYGERRKNPVISLVLSMLFGWAGADRFYLGQVGIGFSKIAFFFICRFIALIYLYLLNIVNFGNFFDNTLTSDENSLFLIFLLEMLPYTWIIVDVFLIVPLTFKENKRSIEDVYTKLVSGHRESS